MTTLDHALRLAALGLSIIPIPRPDAHHDGKRPAIAWAASQQRLATEAEIRAWFSVPQNIAIITGAISRVVVVDCDTPEALRWATRHLPYTPWQTATGGGGFHLFYHWPGHEVRNRARIQTGAGRLQLDVRGDGGYVLAAPSLHKSGAHYEEAGDWSVPKDALPLFDVCWIARPQPVETPRRTADRPVRPAPLLERARRYLEAIPTPEIGMGSDTATFYAAARLIRGFGLSAAEAEDLLWSWCGNRPGWDRQWVAAKVRAAERYASEPLRGLAS